MKNIQCWLILKYDLGVCNFVFKGKDSCEKPKQLKSKTDREEWEHMFASLFLKSVLEVIMMLSTHYAFKCINNYIFELLIYRFNNDYVYLAYNLWTCTYD